MKNQIFRLQEKNYLRLYQCEHYREFPPLTKYFIVDDGTGMRKHYEDCKTLREAKIKFNNLTN